MVVTFNIFIHPIVSFENFANSEKFELKRFPYF